jgi:glucan phosphoethanolaminetransferase (alkaline phosphatase superfamily)
VTWNVRTLAKIAAVILIFALAPWGWLDIIWRRCTQLYADGKTNQLGRFVVMTALMFAGIAITAFLRDARLRLTIALLFAIGFAADQIALAITGQHTSIELMQVVWSERALAADTAATYATAAIKVLAWICPLFIILALKPSDHSALASKFAVIPLICFAAAPANIFVTSQKIDEYPSPYAVKAQLIYAVFGKQVYAGPRQDVAYPMDPKPLFEKLVFVIDESIRADYLQINKSQFDNTPFLASASGRYANFGVAISATNASAGSRVILRTGLRAGQLPDKTQSCLRQPSIWQFAKRAGMRTVYIDAWRPMGEMHSYMNVHELRFIDRHISVRDGPKHLIDAQVAEAIKLELEVPGPALILVEKLGSHFPYGLTALPDVTPDPTYEPAGIDQLPAAQNPAHRAALRDYMRSTRNTVDSFLQSLFAKMTMPGTLAIYTSDHGQSMFEGGYEATHGSMANVHPGEGRVPILVFSGDAAFNERLGAAALAGRDKASHFEIFPTLLLAMGFAQDWVGQNYGASLFEIPGNRRRQFLAGRLFGGSKSKLFDAD